MFMFHSFIHKIKCNRCLYFYIVEFFVFSSFCFGFFFFVFVMTTDQSIEQKNMRFKSEKKWPTPSHDDWSLILLNIELNIIMNGIWRSYKMYWTKINFFVVVTVWNSIEKNCSIWVGERPRLCVVFCLDSRNTKIIFHSDQLVRGTRLKVDVLCRKFRLHRKQISIECPNTVQNYDARECGLKSNK